MRIVFFLVLLLGLGLAGAAAYMVMQQMQTLQAERDEAIRNAQPNILTAPVAIASKNIPFGVPLLKEHVRVVEFPANSIPDNAFSSVEDLVGGENDEPRAVLRRMEKGEVILASKVTRFGQDAGIRSRLDVGMRAFTINVDVTSGVSGFIQPGDRVDIFWTTGSLTKLILQNVSIIAIDQLTDEDANRPQIVRTVTVQVTPSVVAQLAQAQNSGRLSLSLRGVFDDIAADEIETTTDDLVGREVVVQQQEKICSVRMRRGAEIVTVRTECPDENGDQTDEEAPAE